MQASSASSSSDPREALLATYAINDAMNQLILSHLDPRAWRAKLPGQTARGARTIGAIFAHIHNVRLRWLKRNAPHLERTRALDPHRCTMKQAGPALKRSAAQCLGMLTEALSSDPDRRITTFCRDSWMPTWTANPTMFAYMFSHEAHHRGQILMLAHQLGYRISPAKISPMWYWDKLWKQAGVPRPK
jgi:uncharacterized damage-inducible protein DinB